MRDTSRSFMSKRATIRDIARQAGVSKSTVARALSNAPRIAPETRLKIRTLAKKMGYRPDPVLSALAANRWRSRKGLKGMPLAFIYNNSDNKLVEVSYDDNTATRRILDRRR